MGNVTLLPCDPDGVRRYLAKRSASLCVGSGGGILCIAAGGFTNKKTRVSADEKHSRPTGLGAA